MEAQQTTNRLIVVNTYTTAGSGKSTLMDLIQKKLKDLPHVQVHILDDDSVVEEVVNRFAERGVTALELIQDPDMLVDEIIPMKLARTQQLLKSLKPGCHFILSDDVITYYRPDYALHRLIQNEELLPGFERSYITIYQGQVRDQLIPGFPYSQLQLLNIFSRVCHRSNSLTEVFPQVDQVSSIVKSMRNHRGEPDQVDRFRSEMRDSRHRFVPYDYFQQVSIPEDAEVQEALGLVGELFLRAADTLCTSREVPLVSGRKENEEFVAHIKQVTHSANPALRQLLTYPSSAQFEDLWTHHLLPALSG